MNTKKSFYVGVSLIVLLLVCYFEYQLSFVNVKLAQLEEFMITVSGAIPVPNDVRRVELGLLVREVTDKQAAKLKRTDYLTVLSDGEILKYELDPSGDNDTLYTTAYYNMSLWPYLEKLGRVTESNTGIPKQQSTALVTGIALFESGLNTRAASKKSSAKGLLQLTDATMNDCCAGTRDTRLKAGNVFESEDVTYKYWQWHTSTRVKDGDDPYVVYARHFSGQTLRKGGIRAGTAAYIRNPIDLNQDNRIDLVDIKICLDTYATFYQVIANQGVARVLECTVATAADKRIVNQLTKAL